MPHPLLWITPSPSKPTHRDPLPPPSSPARLTLPSPSQRQRSRFVTPHDYISYVGQPDLSVQKTYQCVESLRIALTNNPLTWVQEFGTKGLKQLLSVLNECYRGWVHGEAG